MSKVPMPHADTHCYDEDNRKDVWSYSEQLMQQYGDARAAEALTENSNSQALLREALPYAEWSDKHIHYSDGQTVQHWRLTVLLPVPLDEPDKSPEAALARALAKEGQ